MLTGSATITIDNAINGDINLPARGYAGKSFDGSISINGGGVAIPRFPFTSTDVTATPEDNASVTLHNEWETAANWNNGVCEFESEVNEGDTVVYALKDGNAELASQSIDIFSASTFVFIDGPSTLHIYGAGKTLKIELVINGEPPANGEKPTVAASVGGTVVAISDYLEMGDGTAIDFTTGWSNGVWQGIVRAKSGASEAIISLVASYVVGNDTISETLLVSIVDEMTGSVEFSAGRVAPNAMFELVLSIESLDGEVLSRLPSSGGVTVSHGPESGSASMTVGGVAPVFAFGNGVCELSGCSVNAECIYYVKMTFADGVVVGGTISVTTAVASALSLVEAINERRLAKGDTALDTSVTYTLAQLKAYAEDAISGFVNGAFDENTGLYAAFASSGTIDDVPASEDDYPQWIEEAYDTVCSAVEIVSSAFQVEHELYSTPSGSHYADSHHYINGKWEQPLADAKKSAEKMGSDNFDESNRSIGDGYDAWLYVDKRSVYYGYGQYQGETDDYVKFYMPDCHLRLCKAKCTSSYNAVSRKVVFIAKENSPTSALYKYTRFTNGAKVPAMDKYGEVLNPVFADKNGTFGFTQFQAVPGYVEATQWTVEVLTGQRETVYCQKGYAFAISRCYITYGFKHR